MSVINQMLVDLERRRASGDRVDEREVTARVGRREAHEVDRLEDPRAERQRDPGRLQRRPAVGDPGHDSDGDEDRRPDRLEPDRRPERVAGRLEEDVPARVEDRRDEDEGDREGRHRRSLGAAPPRPGGGAATVQRPMSRRRIPTAQRTTPPIAIAAHRTSPPVSIVPTIGRPRCRWSAMSRIGSGNSRIVPKRSRR